VQLLHESIEIAPNIAKLFPDGHWRHVEIEVADVSFEYVPMPQLIHTVEILFSTYLPLPQTLHSALTTSRTFPAGHGVIQLKRSADNILPGPHNNGIHRENMKSGPPGLCA
jgi:hypothetical protein